MKLMIFTKFLIVSLVFLLFYRPPSPKTLQQGRPLQTGPMTPIGARPAPSAPSRPAPTVPSRMGPSPTPVGNIPFNLPPPLIPS